MSYKPAHVEFPAFNHYKRQAQLIAEQINNTVVTEENIKETKALLADARRVSDALNRRRIDIKKTLLEEYNDFESQVKELAQIIDEADGELRKKVRLLEDIERDNKFKKIEEIWGKRATSYQIYDLAPNAFDIWMEPQMLNKSMSMKAVETNMVDWLEESEKAVETLKTMDDEYLVEYLGCFDIATAINTVNNRRTLAERVNNTKDEDTIEQAIFIVNGKKDIKLTETLLTENEINYTRR